MWNSAAGDDFPWMKWTMWPNGVQWKLNESHREDFINWADILAKQVSSPEMMYTRSMWFYVTIFKVKQEKRWKRADTTSVNQSFQRQRRLTRSPFSRTVGIYSEQTTQKVNTCFVHIESISCWDLYLNLIIRNGTNWQSIKDSLASSVPHENLI